MVKFQLYLQKLQFNFLKYWYRLQLALAGFNGRYTSKLPFHWLLACSFQKNKHIKMPVGQTSALKITLEVIFGN